VRRILEAGCGTGMLRAALRRLLPSAHYVALEASEYLCERYGWQHGRIEAYRARLPFDLAVCFGGQQHLAAGGRQPARARFGRLARGEARLPALAGADLAGTCAPPPATANVR